VWEDTRTMDLVQELLQARYPDAKIIPYTEFPLGYGIDSDKTAASAQEKGCQAVILGNAG
jgi:hypothetical protein